MQDLFDPKTLTGEMVRAGRAIARMEQSQLAYASGLSLETIKRLERVRGVVNANPATLSVLLQAFGKKGVRFCVDAPGRSAVILTPAGEAARIDALSEPTPLHSALYYSAATPETLANTSKALDEILTAASALNDRLGVTGALLYANGCFLQALEGSAAAVSQVLGLIAMDRRHRDFTPISRGEVDRRRFPAWVMCGAEGEADLAGFDPAVLDGDGANAVLARVSTAESVQLAEL